MVSVAASGRRSCATPQRPLPHRCCAGRPGPHDQGPQRLQWLSCLDEGWRIWSTGTIRQPCVVSIGAAWHSFAALSFLCPGIAVFAPRAQRSCQAQEQADQIQPRAGQRRTRRGVARGLGSSQPWGCAPGCSARAEALTGSRGLRSCVDGLPDQKGTAALDQTLRSDGVCIVSRPASLLSGRRVRCLALGSRSEQAQPVTLLRQSDTATKVTRRPQSPTGSWPRASGVLLIIPV